MRGAVVLLVVGLVVAVVLALAAQPRATVLLGLAMLPAALVWAAHALVGRVRLDGDALHVRTLVRRLVVPLEELDTPVLTRSQIGTHLHLRRHGGRHVATLSSTGWGAARVELLAERLAAVPLALRPGPVLEMRYPGSLSWWGRHPLLARVVARVGFVAVLTLAALAVGEALR
ncbi:hypothetical protein [Actinotalea caeni]|uniref:hypothetical protein n=1 Tax=Actinotalea caeni TaxID=1348467 RepID=UPI0012E1985A|nr:hypothetical protein [Actinotalea caeni]